LNTLGFGIEFRNPRENTDLRVISDKNFSKVDLCGEKLKTGKDFGSKKPDFEEKPP